MLWMLACFFSFSGNDVCYSLYEIWVWFNVGVYNVRKVLDYLRESGNVRGVSMMLSSCSDKRCWLGSVELSR